MAVFIRHSWQSGCAVPRDISLNPQEFAGPNARAAILPPGTGSTRLTFPVLHFATLTPESAPEPSCSRNAHAS